MPEIVIRPAEAEDIPYLVELEHNYTSDYVWTMDTQHASGVLPASEPSIQVFFRQIRYPRTMKIDYPRPVYSLQDDWSERSGVLVATLEGEPIGYISLSLALTPTAGWVTDLVVRRALRRQGVGTVLLLSAMEWTTNHGRRLITVEVQTKNHPAIQMLEKLGFEYSGFMDHFYANGEIGLFFSKPL